MTITKMIFETDMEDMTAKAINVIISTFAITFVFLRTPGGRC